VELDLDPAQPPAVVRAVRELLAARAPAPDPWWQEGLAESLEPTGDEP
jgi:hypothetical protein